MLTWQETLAVVAAKRYFCVWSKITLPTEMKREEKRQMRAFHFVTAAWPYIYEPVTRALLTSLDDEWLARIRETMSHEEIVWDARRIQDWRKKTAREQAAQDPVNLPAVELLEDYVERRKGKVVEARKQLRRRFDGLDHDLQVKVARAFLTQPCQSDREFMYKKLASGVFWDDSLTSLVENLWVATQDRKLAVVVARRARRAFVRRHFHELDHNCAYADLCIGAGEIPDEDRLSPWTYLFVMSRIGGKLRPREGRQAVLNVVLQYLQSPEEKPEKLELFDVPHVSRMTLYLGAMGEVDEVLALQRFATLFSKAKPEDREALIAREWEEDVPIDG